MSWYSDLFKIIRFLFFINLFTANLLFSQNKVELEKKKKENIEQIDYIRNMVEKMIKSKEASLNQINLIQKRIELRQGLLATVSEEIKLIGKDIEYNTEEIKRINSRIESLKLEYAELIKNCYKILDKEYVFMFILSSQDINQVYLRIKYLRYMTDYRKKLISELDTEKINYQLINKNLINYKTKNIKLMNEYKFEVRNLDNDKKEKVALVRSLQKKEADLKREMQRREKIMVEIETELKRLIEEEARKAREARGNNILTESERILSSEFGKNQGKLTWPLEQGIITGKFGKQNHAVLKNVTLNNIGVDITTFKGAKVRAVFDGKISSVIAIMGANYSVMIKHGEFFTVYQNLIDLRVKTGDIVKVKEYIGTAFTDMENITKIHFVICKEKFLDPEAWLSK